MAAALVVVNETWLFRALFAVGGVVAALTTFWLYGLSLYHLLMGSPGPFLGAHYGWIVVILLIPVLGPTLYYFWVIEYEVTNHLVSKGAI